MKHFEIKLTSVNKLGEMLRWCRISRVSRCDTKLLFLSVSVSSFNTLWCCALLQHETELLYKRMRSEIPSESSFSIHGAHSQVVSSSAGFHHIHSSAESQKQHHGIKTWRVFSSTLSSTLKDVTDNYEHIDYTFTNSRNELLQTFSSTFLI